MVRLLDAAEEPKAYGEFTGGVTLAAFETNTLPLKLQARGDTADPIPHRVDPKAKPNKKKTLPPVRGAPHKSTPPAEGVNPLDMDFKDMDGIVDTTSSGLPSAFPESRNASDRKSVV